MFEDHFEERVRDIADQVKNGVTTLPLLMMVLSPEGNPVWDKATKHAALYRRYRDALKKEGVEIGILIQASLGHGYKKTRDPFQPVVDLKSGEERYVCCPLDREFLEHFKGVLRILAAEHPKAIMLDDDFRLMVRPGLGCGCPLHMAEFNKRAGTNLSREELWEHITSNSPDDPLTDIMREVQLFSLEACAIEFRSAIDEIDPEIQGINCTSGHICEAVDRTNKAFAGKNNPTIVRIPNGIYAPRGLREMSEAFRQAAICRSRLKKRGIDYVLAETDTIPFNRYSKSARFLHAHYVGSLLEGLSGAKHWLTRTGSYEFASGVQYRKILAEHKGMYEAISEIGQEIDFFGINSFFIEQEKFRFDRPIFNRFHKEHWITCHFERMGLPYYFSDVPRGAAFIEDPMVDDMTDADIAQLFNGCSVFMDGESAKKLFERGFGNLLGVEACEWDLGNISGECYAKDFSYRSQTEKGAKKLIVKDESVKVYSYNYRLIDGVITPLAPAVTSFERDGGLLSVIFCGSPDVEPSYTEGYSFLNESRKAQLVELLKLAGALPAYVSDDSEINMRGGYLNDGEMLLCLTPLGIDPSDTLELYLEAVPNKIELMQKDGTRKEVTFSSLGDSKYSIDVRVEAMYPIILFIKK